MISAVAPRSRGRYVHQALLIDGMLRAGQAVVTFAPSVDAASAMVARLRRLCPAMGPMRVLEWAGGVAMTIHPACARRRIS